MSWYEDICQDWGVGCAVHVYPCAVVVEGHRGLLVYTPALIKIRRKRGTVTVEGDGLITQEIGKERLIVKGRVDRVEWQ